LEGEGMNDTFGNEADLNFWLFVEQTELYRAVAANFLTTLMIGTVGDVSAFKGPRLRDPGEFLPYGQTALYPMKEAPKGLLIDFPRLPPS
jgi:hypothetical protein